jgi:hypothetical protein
MFVLTCINDHFKRVIRWKDTMVSVTAILGLQAQCTSIMSFEIHRTHHECMGINITLRESLFSFLQCFSIAQDRAVDAGGEYNYNDTIVDFFSIKPWNWQSSSSQWSTLEYQCEDIQVICRRAASRKVTSSITSSKTGYRTSFPNSY